MATNTATITKIATTTALEKKKTQKTLSRNKIKPGIKRIYCLQIEVLNFEDSHCSEVIPTDCLNDNQGNKKDC